MHIGEVDFHDRQTCALDGVMQGDGCVGQRPWVEHRTQGLTLTVHAAIGVDFVDQVAFMVALVAFDLQTQFGRGGGAQGVDIFKGGRAVNLGLAPAKQVEIGAMKNQDHHDLSIRWGFVASGSVVPLKTIGFFRWTTP